MIKLIIFFFIIFYFNSAISRDAGETEITTEDGIEVFQEEKYYLLKKNVEIFSDDLELKGQLVKIFFEKDLYDIKELVASENVEFVSELYNLNGKGNNVKFNTIDQKIFINGKNSELYLETTEMLSDGKIIVNNLNSTFLIDGPNSKLVSDNIYITGSKIDGTFETINNKRDIANLNVEDKNKLNIKTDDIEMFSKKAIYDKKKSTIELFDNVLIKRGNEIISGDYGIINTAKSSYKVSSNNSKKVKAIIVGTDE